VDDALNRRQFSKPIAVSAGPGQAVADAGRHRGNAAALPTSGPTARPRQGDPGPRLLAKLNTAGAARRVCADADDILDGNGTLLDFHVAQRHADIEAVCTYQGTGSIQSLIVGRAITVDAGSNSPAWAVPRPTTPARGGVLLRSPGCHGSSTPPGHDAAERAAVEARRRGLPPGGLPAQQTRLARPRRPAAAPTRRRVTTKSSGGRTSSSSTAASAAVLGTTDAYHLPPAPGSALLKVDADSPVRFTVAQVSSNHLATRTGQPLPDGDDLLPVAVGVQPRILDFTPTQPSPRPPAPPATVSFDSPSEQPGAGTATDLDTLVAGLAGAGRPVHQVWLPPLAAAIPLDGLLEAAARGWLRVPVGLVDRPADQVQQPLVLDLSGSAGHLAVVGAPRTGKSTLLCTLVAALAATHLPGEVQAYAIDLGGGLLHRLTQLPHVGAVCGKPEPERAHRLVRELRSLVVERERRFRDLGVDSMADWHQLRRAGLAPGGYGEVFLIVDGWGALTRELPALEAEIGELAATGLHYGVHLVLTANRWADLRPGLRDNLGGRLELRLNDPVESEVGRAAAASLPELPGRGLTQSGLQFQAALPGPTERVLGRALASPGGTAAPPLRFLPALVGEGALPGPGPRQPAGVPFALEEHQLELVRLDLFKGPPHLLGAGRRRVRQDQPAAAAGPWPGRTPPAGGGRHPGRRRPAGPARPGRTAKSGSSASSVGPGVCSSSR
jgi:DNA translocase FtsK/SpoIIIE-like protein